jgi:enamine deaminase RidA (YjgF/YER057c/UK114 family)
MDDVVRISSGTPWETVFGYSRAVRAGDWVMVSGTTATDERGRLVGIDQMYVQARQALANIAKALERNGLGLDKVVRTRIFVTDLSRFAELARAHQESFGDTPPTSTVVEVRRLVHPGMLVEIEADAYAGPRRGANPEPKEPSTKEAHARATARIRRKTQSPRKASRGKAPRRR